MTEESSPPDVPSTKELERFFSLSLDMLCIAAFDGYFKSLSPSFTETLGWSADELRAKPFIEFVHPEDVDATLAEVGRLAENMSTVHFENRWQCRDGTYRWLAWKAVPIAAEGRMYAVARDVTAAKETQLAQERLVRIIEFSPDLVASADPAGNMVYINKAGRELLGAASDEELIGRSVESFYTAPALEKIRGEVLPQALESGNAYAETTLLRADGSELPVSIGLIAHRDPDGKLAQLSTVMRDISELKAVDQLKSEFVSTVSHELRTPLTSVRGSIGLLLGGVAGELPAQATELLEIARSNSERLIRLVNDILDLERIEAGRIEFQREKVPMNELAQRAATEVSGAAVEAGVSILVEDSAAVAVEADRDRLIQVITNLLGNAIKFSPADSSVVVQVHKTGGEWVRTSVRDEGPGIAPEDVERVFGRFQQLEGGDDRQRGGSGLGLAIAKAIVEELGGRIGVTSELGQGSTFWFDLPLRPDTLELPIQSADTAMASAPRVLVVEDDHALASVIVTMVEREGYEAEQASTLAAALDILQRERFDAVLLDMVLPDGNGFEVLDAINARPVEEQTPVIVITGSAEPRKYGSPVLLEWLEKPFDTSRLLATLHRATGRERAAKVLIVEDDQDSRRLIAAQLQQLGCECVMAADGAEALRTAEREDPDLIVLDVGLPVLDGFEVVDLLKRHGRPSVPLIVHTGQDLNAEEREQLRLGVTRHLVKLRTTESEFLSAVREMLSTVDLRGGVG